MILANQKYGKLPEYPTNYPWDLNIIHFNFFRIYPIKMKLFGFLIIKDDANFVWD